MAKGSWTGVRVKSKATPQIAECDKRANASAGRPILLRSLEGLPAFKAMYEFIVDLR